MKTIYDLKNHETLKVDCEVQGSNNKETYFVTRVANGWIYRCDSGINTTTVFVPFDIEWDPADG